MLLSDWILGGAGSMAGVYFHLLRVQSFSVFLYCLQVTPDGENLIWFEDRWNKVSEILQNPRAESNKEVALFPSGRLPTSSSWSLPSVWATPMQKMEAVRVEMTR